VVPALGRIEPAEAGSHVFKDTSTFSKSREVRLSRTY